MDIRITTSSQSSDLNPFFGLGTKNLNIFRIVYRIESTQFSWEMPKIEMYKKRSPFR